MPILLYIIENQADTWYIWYQWKKPEDRQKKFLKCPFLRLCGGHFPNVALVSLYRLPLGSESKTCQFRLNQLSKLWIIKRVSSFLILRNSKITSTIGITRRLEGSLDIRPVFSQRNNDKILTKPSKFRVRGPLTIQKRHKNEFTKINH